MVGADLEIFYNHFVTVEIACSVKLLDLFNRLHIRKPQLFLDDQ